MRPCQTTAPTSAAGASAVGSVCEIAAQRDDREDQERGDQRQVGCQLEHETVGAVGDEILFEEQLDPIGQGLERGPRVRRWWGRCAGASR